MKQLLLVNSSIHVAKRLIVIHRLFFLPVLLLATNMVNAQLSAFPIIIDFTAAKPAYITVPSGTAYNSVLTDCSSNVTGGISYSSSGKSWTLVATKCGTIIYTVKQPSTARAVTVTNNKNAVTKTTTNIKNTCETDTLDINYDGTGGDITITFAGASGGSGEAVVALAVYDIGTVPVIFTGFNAHEIDNGVNVNWNIGVEANINRYEIESSSDAINFTTIGYVNATGAQNYSWSYNTAVSNNNFYRIKIIDNSGNISYSYILNLRANNSGIPELIVAPNPVVNHHFNLQLKSFIKGNYTATLYNSSGVKAYTSIINHAGGTSSKIIQLPSSLQRGIYMLKLTGTNTQVNKTLIVQ